MSEMQLPDERLVPAARFMVAAHTIGYGLNGAAQGGILNDRAHIVPFATIGAYVGALIGLGGAVSILEHKATRGEIITRGVIAGAVNGNTVGLLVGLAVSKQRRGRIIAGVVGAALGAIAGGFGTRHALDKAATPNGAG